MGLKKIQVVLETKYGITAPPACTIGETLARHGLSVGRQRPGAYPAPNDALTRRAQPYEVWTFDFKGWFELANNVRCDPLTVRDRHSRYILALRTQPNQQFKGTLRTCRDLMRQGGVPFGDQVRSRQPNGVLRRPRSVARSPQSAMGNN